jgi:hypothetical protein
MKNTTLPGVILLILGVCILIYQGFSYSKKETVLEIGPAKVEAETRRSVPIPPIIGWVVVAGGAALLFNGLRQRA